MLPDRTHPAVVADSLLQSTGGDDIATRVDVFEEIYLFFLLLGTLVGVIVVSYMLHKAYKYRAGTGHEYDIDRPQLGELPTGADKGGRKLFLSFGLSAIIVVSLIGWTYGWLLYVETGAAEPGEDALEVTVTGDGFAWFFEYHQDGEETVPADEIDTAVDDLGEQAVIDALQRADTGDDVDDELAAAYEQSDLDEDDRQSAEDIPTNVETSSTMRIPVDREIFMYVTSGDVWHNFGIPEFRVKSDAIPDETTTTWFVAEETGDYTAECFELCGSRHTEMMATVTVMEQAEFEDWYDGQTVGIDEAIQQIEAGEFSDAEDGGADDGDADDAGEEGGDAGSADGDDADGGDAAAPTGVIAA